MAPNEDPASRALLILWLWVAGWIVFAVLGSWFERRRRKARWWRGLLEHLENRRREW